MLPDPLAEIEQALSIGLELPTTAVERLTGLEGESLDRFRSLWNRLGAEEREALLSAMGEAAEENLVLDFAPAYALALVDPDPSVRELGLRLASEEADPDLLDTYVRSAVADPDPDVRLAALEELGSYTLAAQVDDWPAEVQQKLEQVLTGVLHLPDADTMTRRAALLSLSFLTTPQTELEIRQAHLQPDLRDAAIEAMGRNCQEIWIPDIRAEMHGEIAHLRATAAQAAAELEDAELVPDLIQRLSDPESDVRLAAIHALGLIGGKDAKAALSELLQSRDREIRAAAREAMQDLLEGEDPLALR